MHTRYGGGGPLLSVAVGGRKGLLEGYNSEEKDEGSLLRVGIGMMEGFIGRVGRVYQGIALRGR